MQLRKPYLLFLGDSELPTLAKTAFGLRDWCPGDVVGQWALAGCLVDLGIDRLEPTPAVAAGARSLVIGVAAPGGSIPAAWENALETALLAGLDIVSGMHTRLRDLPKIAALADRTGRTLHDVRDPGRTFPVGTGTRRTGRRLLTVGTDCAIGKKYTALALAKALAAAGHDAAFRATGQTGIMIAGGGVPLDAVVADFLAGAAETLSPAAAPAHWDVIEGQGSLFHPSYAGVTLGLVHGSQPDAMILCHDFRRRHIELHPNMPIPALPRAISVYEDAAQLTNARARVVAVSINTAHLSEQDALSAAKGLENDLNIPCFDPMRFGIDAVIASLDEIAPC